VNRWEQIDTATLPDGDVMTLHRRADEFSLRVAAVELMNSRQHGSEEQLASLALARLGRLAGARVLVGGLGMGFTLRAVLDALPADASVTVAELVPQVVEWNGTHLGGLAGNPLSDARATVIVGDVAALLRASTASFDVVLLDTDNGPEGTTQEKNEWLYGPAGLDAIRSALTPGGVLAVWSVFPSEPFTRRLGRAGFEVEVKHVRSRGTKGNRHVIWVARRPGAAGRDRAASRTGAG
jgi:spermidine synthase